MESCSGRQRPDYHGLCLLYHWPPMIHRTGWPTNWLINELIDRGSRQLTGDSGIWSSSREKELLKALLNVSLFCLCRSIVARITWEFEEGRGGGDIAEERESIWSDTAVSKCNCNKYVKWLCLFVCLNALESVMSYTVCPTQSVSELFDSKDFKW